jgi:hypothetical protein
MRKLKTHREKDSQGIGLASFIHAREEIRARADDRSFVAKILRATSQATYYRLLQDEEAVPSERFNASTRARIISLLENPEARSLYESLALQIDQNPSDRAALIERYCGEYRKFRFHSPRGGYDLKLVVDRLRIYVDKNGDPTFGIWTHDYDHSHSEPEMGGHVFRSENRLYFMGAKRGSFSMSIAQASLDAKEDAIMPGLQLSVSGYARTPFASRFFLVPFENRRAIQRLDPAHPDSQKYFMALSEGHDVFFLLAA